MVSSHRSTDAKVNPIPRDRPDQQAAGPDQLDIETMVAHAHGRSDERRPTHSSARKDPA
ncbi:hypothetical protein GCM10010336_61920 [Streptomyces goshikiensis]|nr:hypothetical protein GCM10010336_61920 [Streptomyces goshikiensis]